MAGLTHWSDMKNENTENHAEGMEQGEVDVDALIEAEGIEVEYHVDLGDIEDYDAVDNEGAEGETGDVA